MPRTEANISREALWGKLDYKPHSQGQLDAHMAQERFRVTCCGRRWGKSIWAGREMTHKMFVPNSINWIVGPTYALAEKEFRVVFNDFKKLGLLPTCKKVYNVDQGKMRIHFPQINSLVEAKSATKPDSLVGEGVDHMIVSEAAKHNRSTWEMYLRPALADKEGSADFPSTPQGYNWYKGLFDLGQEDEYKEYFSHRYPSWENPVIFPGGRTDGEIIAVEATVSEMFFQQEIAAEFTAFEGMIYPEFKEEIHIQDFEYNPANRNWLALDFGYVDPFVALDIMIDTQQRVWVWREYMVSYKSTYEHGHILKERENPPGYHIDGIAADPRGADEIATLSWILGGIQAHAVGWGLGIESVKRALTVRDDDTPGLIIHPRCKELIRQLRNLRNKQGREERNSPEGQHDYDDHGPDALRYFFNEYFVLGAGDSIADFYGQQYLGSEAASFFRYEGSVSGVDGQPVPLSRFTNIGRL
jgi:hypothetical protein